MLHRKILFRGSIFACIMCLGRGRSSAWDGEADASLCSFTRVNQRLFQKVKVFLTFSIRHRHREEQEAHFSGPSKSPLLLSLKLLRKAFLVDEGEHAAIPRQSV